MSLQAEAICEVRCQESGYPLGKRLEEQREVCGCGWAYSVSENSSSSLTIHSSVHTYANNMFLEDVFEVCLVLRS